MPLNNIPLQLCASLRGCTVVWNISRILHMWPADLCSHMNLHCFLEVTTYQLVFHPWKEVVITHCKIRSVRLAEKHQCFTFGAVLLQLPRQCHARAPRVWYHTLRANCQNLMTLRRDGNFLHGEVMLTLGNIQKKRNIFWSVKVWTVSSLPIFIQV